MRILQVVTDTDRRGAQVFAVDLGDALGSLGHTVTTVALARGLSDSQLDIPKLGESQRGPQALRRLRSLMGAHSVTIAHGSSTLLACAVAGLGGRRPFVYRQISDTRFWARSPLRRARVAAYLRCAERVVALAPDAAEALVRHVKVPRSRIDVIPNGVPSSRFPPASPGERRAARASFGLPHNAQVALCSNALVPEKGTEIAIRAVANCQAVHLLVAGAGPEHDALFALGEALAPARVHFVGSLRDPLPAYHAADVVLLPSLGGDSMPASLIEAGMCQLPAISTDVGSIASIVDSEHTGLLVDRGSVPATTEALTGLLEDQERRQRLGRSARVHCLARYEIDVVADAWASTLSTVLNSTRSGRH